MGLLTHISWRQYGAFTAVPSLPPLDSLRFDYTKVDSRYKVDEDPLRTVILYKGGFVGRADSGFASLALCHGVENHVAEVKDLIEGADHESIRELFDQHSELVSSCGNYILSQPEDYSNRSVKDPSNWQHLGN